jgi:hypothetical protein
VCVSVHVHLFLCVSIFMFVSVPRPLCLCRCMCIYCCVCIFMFVAGPLCLYVRSDDGLDAHYCSQLPMAAATALVDLSRAGNIDGADHVIIIIIGFTFPIYMSKLPA